VVEIANRNPVSTFEANVQGTCRPTSLWPRLWRRAKILALCGREDLRPDVRAQAEHEILEQYLDPTRARQVLGWEAGFTHEEGLAPAVGWYRTFLAHADSH